MNSEFVEQLSRGGAAAYVLLTVDNDGDCFAAASQVPLALSLSASKSQANVSPHDLLVGIKVIESLVQVREEKREAVAKGKRGRKRKESSLTEQVEEAAAGS